MSDKYWLEMYQLKVHIRFIELLLQRSEVIDRTLKVILAFASSTSIGAWAVWQEHSLLWAGIIALSQVISAVNPLLPYNSKATKR